MSMTDPIADLLTRIRNANKAGQDQAGIPFSRPKEGILQILKDEGFIKSFETVGEIPRKNLVVKLKYKGKMERVIESLVKISKPGRRVYVGHKDIRHIRRGLGVMILSTPKGIVTDTAAKKMKVGGEWLCSVW